MSTKISVVVGADGLKAKDSSTRQARRRDRLDSEALKEQLKLNAGNNDNDGGFNNKKKKGELLDDPAAHARKKVSASGLCGAIIEEIYEKEIGDPSEIFPAQPGDWTLSSYTGAPENYRDQFLYGYRGGGRFMQINIQAISKEGIKSSEPLTINLERNRRNPVFCVEQPEHYRYNDQYQLLTSWNNPPERYDMPFKRCGFGGGEDRYTVDTVYYRVGQKAYWGSMAYEVTSDLNASGNWVNYFGNCQFSDCDGHGNGRGNQQNKFFSWGEYQVDNYNFPVIDSDTGEELYWPNDVPEWRDPGYQLYILPLNDSHGYIVILFNDVDVNLRGLDTSSGSISNWSFEDQWPFSKPENGGAEIWVTSCEWSLSSSNYVNPLGVDITIENDLPVTSFTDEAKNLFQQIYIVELKDGAATLIDQAKISDKLRDAIAIQMPLNLKNQYEKATYRTTLDFYKAISTGLYWDGTHQRELDYSYKPTIFYPDFKYIIQPFNYRDSATRGIIDFNTYPRFAFEQARNLSIGKGYGIGLLTTDNHFNSPYNDPSQTRFPQTSRYMANDIFFTPAIYHYLDPQKGIIPTLNYPTFAVGLGDVGPKRFLSLEPASGSVKVLDYMPSGNISTPIEESSFLGSSDAPAIKNATHVAWNWDDPQLCWQYLIDMGFTAAMIGPKPAPPKEPQ